MLRVFAKACHAEIVDGNVEVASRYFRGFEVDHCRALVAFVAFQLLLDFLFKIEVFYVIQHAMDAYFRRLIDYSSRLSSSKYVLLYFLCLHSEILDDRWFWGFLFLIEWLVRWSYGGFYLLGRLVNLVYISDCASVEFYGVSVFLFDSIWLLESAFFVSFMSL